MATEMNPSIVSFNENNNNNNNNNNNDNNKLKGNQVLIRVYFIDDTHKTISIDPTQTTGDQLWDLVSEKLGINNRDAECFFLWAQNDEIEWLLFNHQNISDVIKNWGILKRRYCEPVSEGTGIISKANKTLSKKTGVLEGKLGFLTIGKKSGSKNQNNAMSKAIANDHANAHLKSSFPTLGEEGHFRLVYRPTSVLPISVEKSITTSESTHLFYIQAVYNIINSNYPCEEDIALKLASIQLQVQVGDQKPEHNEYFKESLSRYIPTHLIQKHKPEEWEALVSPQHILLRGSDSIHLKRAYLETCQRWQYYGCTFFSAKYVPVTTSFFLQEFEGKVSIGINGHGIHIIDPKAMKIVSYHYRDIAAWDSTINSFSVQVAVRNNKQSDQIKIYTFTTLQGELINDLMHDWLNEEWSKEAKNTNQQQFSQSMDKTIPNSNQSIINNSTNSTTMDTSVNLQVSNQPILQ
ncbi:Band 4.1 domain-containing protein [Tieghemostelium lacteum]|uniref:Band 4.1 domain-containing protein n=1 Tax=Tieghemostelium lacteum TaxID=361077 RepID=A0A151ZD36_TIELA|nr:Band 4.1 domain-containing protein [Tieghemostelium lacteum]|eukprot:KYQ91868.1 Band 4.1 domain-containing protein [Tieghemostelium lacteum]